MYLDAGGFLGTVTNESMLCIPSGFIIVMCSSQGEETLGLRWSLSSDQADCRRVAASIQELIDDFPDMRQEKNAYTTVLNRLAEE